MNTIEPKSTDKRPALFLLGIIILFIIGGIVITQSSRNNNSTNSEPSSETSSVSETKLEIVNTISNNAVSSSADGGYCFAEYIEPDDSLFASVASMGTAATYYFVETAKQVFASGACTNYTFAYSMNGESSRGGTSKFTLGAFSVTAEKFSLYDWESLSGRSVGESLSRDGILNIPANVRSQIDYKDFKYRN